MRVPTAAIVLVLTAAGCTVDADFTGTAYRCAAGGVCPPGYACVQDRCVLPGPDAAVPDGQLPDAAPPPDAAAVDGGADAGDNCGDGTITPEEECDDGDEDDLDGCTSECRWARCGDGIVRAGVEECDDGNLTNYDGCSSSCLRCDQGVARLVWPAIGGHCYTVHDELVPWGDARAACASLGGHLVTYASAEEDGAVATALLGGARRWLGLTDSAVEGTFAWITGETVPYTHFASGQPDDYMTGEDCVETYATGTWNDQSCGDAVGYLCEQDGWTIRPEDRHAYRVFYAPRAWDAARDGCLALGGHLVTIGDAGEQAFVASLVDLGAWIGLSDGGVEGTFAWVTGEPLDYLGWHPGEPNGIQPGDDCAQVNYFSDDSWSDDDCALPRAWVCEID